MFIGAGRNSDFSRIWLHRLAPGAVADIGDCVVVGCKVESDSVLVLA